MGVCLCILVCFQIVQIIYVHEHTVIVVVYIHSLLVHMLQLPVDALIASLVFSKCKYARGIHLLICFVLLIIICCHGPTYYYCILYSPRHVSANWLHDNQISVIVLSLS